MKKLILFLFCFSCLIFANEDNYVCKNAIGDVNNAIVTSEELGYILDIITSSDLDLNNYHDRYMLNNLVYSLDKCNNYMGITLKHIKEFHSDDLSSEQLDILNNLYNIHKDIKEDNLKLNKVLYKEAKNEN